VRPRKSVVQGEEEYLLDLDLELESVVQGEEEYLE